MTNPNQAVLDEMASELKAVVDCYVGSRMQAPEAMAVAAALECATAYALTQAFGLTRVPGSDVARVINVFVQGLCIRVDDLRRAERARL